MDKDFNSIGHIAFTNLYNHSFGMTHSGDIQNAPNGASEFIDIDVKHAASAGARYISMSVISYRGEAFKDLKCYAGYMGRDSLKSGKLYEPASVEMKFTVDAETTSVSPLVFDIVNNMLIFMDLSGPTSRYQAIGAAASKHAVLTKMALTFPERKPTLGEILSEHASARGKIVMDKDDADVVYDLSIDVDAVVSEFTS